MNKKELLDILEDAEDDAEIFMISQPSRHPLVYALSAYSSGAAGDNIYLVESKQIGYLESEIKEELNLY